MVFAIPDWEDGNDKTNKVFSAEHKKKQKTASPKQKQSPAKAKLNGVSKKSKLINKENKKGQKKNLNVKTVEAKVEKELPRKSFQNGQKTKENQKHTEVSNKLPKKIVNSETSENKNIKSDSANLRVENLETDKFDEVLLNAKKKKFNEALQKDDVEALLFQEDKIPEVKKIPAKLNGVTKISDKKNIKRQEYTDKKQKKLNNKIIEVKNNNLIDAENNNVDDVSKVCLDNKKEKLKGVLKKASNRNPINFNRNKLRERMMDRLKSAQFRYLNEKLYTSSGREASELFQSDPAAFHNYHEGYQQQVKKWPVNPLDIIVKRIQKMPKSHLIADMGCGEAALSKRVPHTVRSFDLVSTAPGVEVCDMAHTPLLAASMNVVVYCLALMGTELTKYLLEANRVLKMGGHLLIAEVESRFTDVNAFTKEVSRLGFKLQKVDNEREVFIFMEFVKNQDPPVKKAKLPVLTLKPCIYKRR